MKVKISNFLNFLGEKVVVYFVLSIVAGVFWFLIETAFVFVLQSFLITLKIMSPEDSILSSFPPLSVAQSASILFGFGVLRGAGAFAKMYITNVAQYLFINSKRKQIVEIGMSAESNINTSETMSMFTEVVYMASSAVSQISNFLVSSVMTILFITYGFYLAPKEMVIGLFLLGILVIPLKLLTSSIHKTGEGLVVEWNRIHDILFLGLKNNFLLRVYDLIDQEVQKSRDVIDRYCKHQVSYAMTSAFLYSLPVVVGVLIISVITYVSLTYFNRPGAVLLAFFYVFIRIAQASSDSFNTLSLIRLNIPAFKKLYSWYIGHFILAKKETKIPSAELIQENVESIEFDKVTFGYDSSEKPVLDELSFKIVRGKMLLIKGESGSGKSTLLSILLGLNIPQSGNVLLNEKKNRLQKEKVAYVGPESYLIPGSVKENLMYGQGGERSDSEVWEALRLANVDLEIKKLPNGLAEHLNEFTQLSTGQKQRLAIARALLRKPDVLILDEATSNLDTETEAEIINQIKQIKKDFVTVVISHKNSFDAVSDICIELT